MDVGLAELFRYTPEMLAHWPQQTSGPFAWYPDYQVVRLWEDVWDLSSWALEAIPADVLAARSLADEVGQQLCRPQIDRWSDDEVDLFALAHSWWDDRRLSTLHLRQGPTIRFWREGDAVHIGWENHARRIDGIPVWTAMSGMVTYALNDFVEQMRQFHSRLADAMRPRVEHVRRFGPPVSVRIDLPELLATQAAWDAGMEDPVKRQARTDWEEVRSALEQVRSLLT